MDYDLKRLEWVEQHLETLHNEISPEEARNWHRDLVRDPTKFTFHAVKGFTLHRKKMTGQLSFSGEELRTFCDEFALKISLAAGNVKCTTGLPLFEIVGTKALTAAIPNAVPFT